MKPKKTDVGYLTRDDVSFLLDMLDEKLISEYMERKEQKVLMGIADRLGYTLGQIPEYKGQFKR